MHSDEAVVAAIEDCADRLDPAAVDPGAGGETPAVASLADRLAGAEVAGLGEASHGSRELDGLKATVTRALVERGVRTLALEAPVAATLALDRYVRDASGDAGPDGPAAALSGLDTWLWRTGTVASLLSWLRSFNAGRPAAEQVRVRGVDLRTPATLVDSLRSFLDAVDLPGANLDALAAADAPDVGEEALEGARSAADAVGERLDDRRAACVGATSSEQWHRARHWCRVAGRACEWLRVRRETEGPSAEGMAERDRRMAENVGWALDRDPGEGVVVWAHNSHVKRGTFDDGQVWTDATTMGQRLDDALGDRYRPVGTDFGRGRVRALARGSDDDRTAVFDVGDPRSDSATARFDAAGGGRVLALGNSRLDDWLASPRRIRWIGSVYDPDTPRDHYLRTDLPASFEFLAFVPRSRPTRPV